MCHALELTHRSVHAHTTHQPGRPLHPLPAVAFAGRTRIIDQEDLFKTKKVRHKESPALALEKPFSERGELL